MKLRTSLALFIVICGVMLAQPLPDDPKRTPEEIASSKTAERAERRAAIAKLPLLDSVRLEALVLLLEKIRFPISLKEFKSQIGAPESMVWSGTSDRMQFGKRRSTSSYLLTDPEGKAGVYELVADFAESPLDLSSSLVVRARVAFSSPLGWRFFAESTKQMVEVGKEEANQ